MLTCAQIVDFLMAYLDGELPAQQRAAFGEHLAVCPACRAFMKTYETTVRLERSAPGPIPPVPPELIAAILLARRAE
jgi:anti-sigma factor RsiW